MAGIFINGLVSQKTKAPIIQLSHDDGRIINQMDAQDAIKLACDMIRMAEMAKADALLVRWTNEFFPEEKREMVAAQLMTSFRDFRSELEDESNRRQQGDPEKG